MRIGNDELGMLDDEVVHIASMVKKDQPQDLRYDFQHELSDHDVQPIVGC